jgi:hypothetical protein
LQFDPTGGYAEVLGYAGVTSTQARTLSAWVNTSVEEDMDLVAWGVDQPGSLWALSIVKGGGRSQAKGALKLDLGGSTVAGQTTLTNGQWHHIAVLLPTHESPQTQDIQVYVDGQIEPGTVLGNALVDTAAGSDLRFGMRAGEGWTPFEGLVDEVRIYSRALGTEEIAELAGVAE